MVMRSLTHRRVDHGSRYVRSAAKAVIELKNHRIFTALYYRQPDVESFSVVFHCIVIICPHLWLHQMNYERCVTHRVAQNVMSLCPQTYICNPAVMSDRTCWP